MADSPFRRGGLLAALVLWVAVTASPVAAEGEDIGVDAPVRFEAGPGTTFELDDGRRLADTLELRPSSTGSALLVNELSMDAYVAGVAEMPPRWHEEALKAQAVAARTYAWRSILRGTFRDRGYDICATVACQVFRGTAVVEESAHGDRWLAAVRGTSGEVLLDDGDRPILARYFSTSGGRTLPNELVFPESGPVPYLVGTEDPDDATSPYHRWRVEFTRDEFDDILSRGQRLAPTVPVRDVERRGPVVDPQARVVVTGEDGTEVAVAASDLRAFVSDVAPSRHPDRFPSRRADGLRDLPATLPSSRFDLEVDDDVVVVEGYGWGHGVGMGQYGARGKALRGMGYEDILASYYNGLRPREAEELPERVRVGLDVDDHLALRADGPFRIVAGDEEVVERALGTWGVQIGGDGLRLAPPDTHGQSLDVDATRIVGGGSATDDHVLVETRVNKPAELSLSVADADGEPVLERDLGVADPGTHAATWRFEGGDGEPVPAGDYTVALVAVDEAGDRGGEAVDVAVRQATDPTRPADGSPGTRGVVTLSSALLGTLVIVGVAFAALSRRRR